ncbi:MAG: efflux RND transporter permease subunit [Chloroflexi bacterium]|nr:efflux RND transporter permease subunit [Chloroflexota bacterium]
MTFLTNWVLKRKAAAVLIAILLLLLGGFSVTQLKSELMPSLDLPYLTVTTVYSGAASNDVMEQVTKPVEQIVGTLPRLKSIRSTSSESFSLVIAELEFGSNIKDAVQTMNTQLRSLQLPTDLRGQTVQPSVGEINISNQAVILLGVEGKNGQTPQELGIIARDKIKPELTTIDGVSSVQVVGDVLKEVRINLKPDQLQQRGLTQNDISTALRGFNVSFPAGTISVEDKNVSIRATYTFGSLDDLKNLPIISATATAGAASLAQVPAKLSDIADVVSVDAPSNSISRTNGNPGVLMQVYKSQSGNTVNVVDTVLKRADELNQVFEGSIKIGTVYEQATQIKQSIDGLIKEGLLGAFFAVLVIFLFLRNVRSTLVTAISIPTSVVAALLLLWTQGITLNIMTLGGLAIAVGRVVDDAIVVLENIFRHVQEGDSISAAVKNGTREVASAITSSTITTVAVFLPLGFVGGLTGQFFLPFALTVTFALLASLIVALTIIPVFASYFINRKVVGSHSEKEDTWLQKAYTPSLRWALRNRWKTLLLAFVLFIGGNALVTQVPFAFVSSSGDKLLNVSISMPPGSDQASILSRTQEIEKALIGESRIELAQTTIAGSSSFNRAQRAFSASSGDAQILLRIKKDADLEGTAKDLRIKLESVKPEGGTISVAPIGGFTSSVFSLVVRGQDTESVRKGSDLIIEKLKDLPEFANLRSDVSAVTPQIVIRPNVAATGGRINTQTLGFLLRSALQPTTVTSVRFEDGLPQDVVIYPPMLDNKNLDQWIENLKATPVYGAFTFGQIANITKLEAPVQTTRIGQLPAATITANMTTDNTGGITREVTKRLADLELPAGVTSSITGVSQQQTEAFVGLFIAMGVAIALVYIVMVVAFGGLLEPFVILFSLPLATIGAFAALFVTHRSLGLPAMIGLLMLIGIVVTNAIVLIDKVNQLRADGLGRHEALIEAGRNRLRPIMMTAVATILALIPLALGLSEGSIIAAELGTVVIGGLLSSTMLTLMVVPVVYSLLDGARARLTGQGRKGKGDGESGIVRSASTETDKTPEAVARIEQQPNPAN